MRSNAFKRSSFRAHRTSRRDARGKPCPCAHTTFQFLQHGIAREGSRGDPLGATAGKILTRRSACAHNTLQFLPHVLLCECRRADSIQPFCLNRVAQEEGGSAGGGCRGDRVLPKALVVVQEASFVRVADQAALPNGVQAGNSVPGPDQKLWVRYEHTHAHTLD